MNISVLDRFLKYVSVDSQSDADSAAVPSTPGQTALARMLVAELEELGAHAELDAASGIVYASIPSNVDGQVPVIGWVAHVDTAPGVSGSGVKPRIVHSYDGGDIILDREQGIVLSPSVFPELGRYAGQDLVVTDGTALLGADDKAGVAEIMDMAASFLLHPERPHGEIRIAFTPDEEIGRGADSFDVARFGADFAYTVDGGGLGEIEYENFNAASAVVTVRGAGIHPGSAKGRMLNACLVLMEFQGMLPVFQNPAFTEGYEGFYHLDSLRGNVEQATGEYLIRDHGREEFERKKEFMRECAALLNRKYGEGTVRVEVKDSYYNMKEKILPHMHLVEHARRAMEAVGVQPEIIPVRGGTDGARLSFMGLPCPNLCAGGHNFHGRHEYVPVQSLEKISSILQEIVSGYARYGLEPPAREKQE
ncbi:peptidase T [Akkermansia muciniphila]|uniref:peptidase T n=1 Tax=Akkermansia muciniphila TaxID=239935 RepID=UPI001BFEF12E|nr:peptidase T [Akkermansia muciniphila]MBT8779102.1 peptidase T [Akkermansia muciniphila]